jgi:hypothetical protein
VTVGFSRRNLLRGVYNEHVSEFCRLKMRHWTVCFNNELRVQCLTLFLFLPGHCDQADWALFEFWLHHRGITNLFQLRMNHQWNWSKFYSSSLNSVVYLNIPNTCEYTGTCCVICKVTYLLTYSLIPWCRIKFEKLIVTQLIRKHPAFMAPEGSSPCSQKSATGPYPEPDEFSSPHRSLSP